MKNIVRAFVVALVLTGSAATAYTAKSGAIVPNTTTVSAMPVPTCPPDDPKGCGLGGAMPVPTCPPDDPKGCGLGGNR